MKSSKNHIEQIKESYIRLPENLERLADTLCGALKIIEKVFARQSHFIMEFIQNADDCGSKKFCIKIMNKNL